MHRSCVLLVIGLLVPLAPCQELSGLLGGFMPQASNGRPQATADLDGDGDQDLVMVRANAVELLANDGEGRFLPWLTFGYTNVTCAAVGDVDGDGDTDLLLGRIDRQAPDNDRLLINDGSGGFTDVTASAWPNPVDPTVALLPVDVDGDGDLDIVACNQTLNLKCGGTLFCPSQNRLYANDGTGVFTDVTAAAMPHTPHLYTSVSAGDLDGDGDTDLAFGIYELRSSAPVQPPIRLMINQGNGTFAEGLSRVPATGGRPYVPSLECVDLDGDGDLDLCASVGIWLNDGTGSFTAGPPFPAPTIARVEHLDVGDVDGDGDADILVVDRTLSSDPAPARLLRNTGNGTFTTSPADTPAVPVAIAAPLLFDADGDGDPDACLGAFPRDLLCFNDGNGALLLLEPIASRPAFADALLLVDIAGDAQPEVVQVVRRSGPTGHRVSWSTLDLEGRLGPEQIVYPGTINRATHAVIAVDFDGDGDEDLYVANGNTPPFSQDRLARNEGNGVFTDVTATHLPVEGGWTQAVAAADLDGDGDLDLVLGNVGQDALLLNRGGRFVDATAGRLPADTDETFAVVAADFDGDGDLDLASANGFAQLRMYLNDGTARFADVSAVLPRLSSSHAYSVLPFDFDGDGDLDLIAGANGGLHFLRNDGTTVVEETGRVTGSRWSRSIHAVDLDRDGDFDLLTDEGFLALGPLGFYRNDGTNRFARIQASWTGVTTCPQLAMDDIDRDGDVGLVLPGTILRNLHRHLVVGLPPRLGWHGELELYALPGYGMAPHTAFLLFASSRASQPFALGSLGVLLVDPGTLFLHGPHFLPAPAGKATVRYLVPASASLVGAALFGQPLILHSAAPSEWRLGNRVALEVRL